MTATTFGEDLSAQAREIVARYPEGRSRSALLPLLHLVQSQEGYVSGEGIKFCAEELDLSTAEVTAVATFYSMYKRQPAGEYLLSVCTNTLCGMLGGDEIFEALSEELGVDNHGTTEDERLTLEHAECLAACDYAPVVTVNYEYFDQQTPESAVEVARRIRAGELPMPTRGAPLCTFKQIERQLAGFPDERAEAITAGGSAGEPSLAGLRLAERHGMTAEGTSEPGRDAAAEEAHEEAGAGVAPTAFSGDREDTTTVTSAGESAEAGTSGGTADKSAQKAAEARKRQRNERKTDDDEEG
ncbi:MAG: NADH-quinone oxidoreductase subunit NuoE [Streptosporangiales bacterium]